MAVNYPQSYQYSAQPSQQQVPQMPAQNMYQQHQFFPQPQGSVYLLNTSFEMANIPTGSGISAAICLSEGVMYLKTMQNNAPVFLTYQILPFEEKEKPTEEKVEKIEEENTEFLAYKEKVDKLEKELKLLKNKGGKV